MVNIEHGCLRTFKQNRLLVIECFVQKKRRFYNIRSKALCIRQIFVANLLNGVCWHVKHVLKQGIYIGERVGKLSFKHGFVEQILHAQTNAQHFVAIGRANAALGCTNVFVAAEHLLRAVEHLVVWHNEVGFARNSKVFAGYTLALKRFDFLEHNGGVYNAPVANNGKAIFVHNTRRYLMERQLCGANHNSVAGVCATRIATYNIKITSDKVGNFTFTFITPLCTNQN